MSQCNSKPASEQLVERVTSRKYRVYLTPPKPPRKPPAVLFALHAYATEPDLLVDKLDLRDLAVVERGWILVVPQGQRDDAGKRYWNATRACYGKTQAAANDLAYLQQVAMNVRERYQVENVPFYVIGVSNGAFMAHRWACDGSANIRAIVTISGVGPGPQDPPCAPNGPVNVLHVHGTEDTVIAYAGGKNSHGTYPSAQMTVDSWLRLNRIDAPPVEETELAFLTGTIRKQKWQHARAAVQLWTVEGGGHRLRLLSRFVPRFLDFLEGK